TMPDSAGLRETVLSTLKSNDYAINNGKVKNTINTVSKTLKNGTRVSYTFIIQGSEIKLTGKLAIAGQSAPDIINQGKKGTPIKNGWEEMEKIAKTLKGSVRYE